MGVNNTLVKSKNDEKKIPFSVAIRQKGWQDLVNNTLGDPERAKRFVAAVTSAVSVNPALQGCDAGSVLSAALLGESLNLSPSPQLGQYYMVPYNQKEKLDRNGKVITPAKMVAQFQIGYKGMIQLAVRSGYYRKIVVLPIKEGELVRYDPMEEEIVVNLIEDEGIREETPTIGYYAMFEYIGGTFRKAMYWSKEKMISHADRYSPAFSKEATEGKYPKVSFADYAAGKYPKGDEWKYSSFWYKDFDGMAIKTMLRQILSKWGIMSVDLQKAFAADENAVNADLTPNYLEPVENNSGALASPENGKEALPPDEGADGVSEAEDGESEELPDGIFGEK